MGEKGLIFSPELGDTICSNCKDTCVQLSSGLEIGCGCDACNGLGFFTKEMVELLRLSAFEWMGLTKDEFEYVERRKCELNETLNKRFHK